MRRFAIAALIFLPSFALAQSGAWSSQSQGPVISRGQQRFKSQPINAPAPLPTGAVASRVQWRVVTATPPPGYLELKLCGGGSCITLPSLSGSRTLPASFPANGPWYFHYEFTTRGALTPPITVLSNQVTVNYRVR
ncbi:flagellar protein FlhE [Cedecea sp.]|jgi:flagellar protein FlhE|uniref:flagellar protein FlhE n=1 Tax=Cedecea sp. TaxID=1970739 RepID=UPI0012AEA544|nr:flagellar protein FlhE [Enterobacteriaceae bacterium RIT693]